MNRRCGVRPAGWSRFGWHRFDRSHVGVCLCDKQARCSSGDSNFFSSGALLQLLLFRTLGTPQNSILARQQVVYCLSEKNI
jgi:hypothetical protein